MADLYDPNTMPPALVKAHQALDKAVDLCYRSQPFINEIKKIEFLFALYDRYTAGLFAKEKKSYKSNIEIAVTGKNNHSFPLFSSLFRFQNTITYSTFYFGEVSYHGFNPSNPRLKSGVTGVTMIRGDK